MKKFNQTVVKTYGGQLKREYELYSVSNTTQIAYVDLLSDNELLDNFATKISIWLQACVTNKAAKLILLTVANKGTPLAHAVGMLLRHAGYQHVYVVVARKDRKVFYGEVVTAEKHSITSDDEEQLCLTESDCRTVLGATNVFILDDVYTTGASIRALRNLAFECGQVVDYSNVYVGLWERDKGEKLPVPIHYVDTLDLYHYTK